MGPAVAHGFHEEGIACGTSELCRAGMIQAMIDANSGRTSFMGSSVINCAPGSTGPRDQGQICLRPLYRASRCESLDLTEIGARSY